VQYFSFSDYKHFNEFAIFSDFVRICYDIILYFLALT